MDDISISQSDGGLPLRYSPSSLLRPGRKRRLLLPLLDIRVESGFQFGIKNLHFFLGPAHPQFCGLPLKDEVVETVNEIFEVVEGDLAIDGPDDERVVWRVAD